MIKLVRGITKYRILKRCLQCFNITDGNLSKCSQCNFIFSQEATEEENQEANDRILKLQEKAKESTID